MKICYIKNKIEAFSVQLDKTTNTKITKLHPHFTLSYFEFSPSLPSATFILPSVNPYIAHSYLEFILNYSKFTLSDPYLTKSLPIVTLSYPEFTLS